MPVPTDPLVYVDDRFVPASEASVSVFDHGLLYGDGIFESVRIREGVVCFQDRVIARLFRSAQAIGLDVQRSPDEIAELIHEGCHVNGLREAYQRLIVTRGVGSLGLDPSGVPRPTVVLITQVFPGLYPPERIAAGLTLATSSLRRPGPEVLNPKVKSLNYLNNVLARAEAGRHGADEALMIDGRGFVSEATAVNLFLVEGGRVVTPPTAWVLPGITRAVVLELAAAEGIEAEERELTLYDVYNADEVFLTGTAAGVVPVTVVDGRQIGTGRPGPMALHLAEAFYEAAVEDGVPLDMGNAPAGTSAGGAHRAETHPSFRRA